MQVVAGSARRIQLKTMPGDQTRPTSNRIKETLFNILQPYIPGCRFLDLYAGSGGIGIEALSRGAERAVFVDHNRQACAVIRENLKRTHLEDKAELYMSDAAAAFKRLSLSEKPFDILFMDPPYDDKWEPLFWPLFSESPLIAPDTMIIIETRINRSFPDADAWGFKILREKLYKNNKHVFIGRKGEEA